MHTRVSDWSCMQLACATHSQTFGAAMLSTGEYTQRQGVGSGVVSKFPSQPLASLRNLLIWEGGVAPHVDAYWSAPSSPRMCRSWTLVAE